MGDAAGSRAMRRLSLWIFGALDELRLYTQTTHHREFIGFVVKTYLLTHFQYDWLTLKMQIGPRFLKHVM